MKNRYFWFGFALTLFQLSAYAHAVCLDWQTPESLVEPHNVTLEAQSPSPGISLFTKDPQHPKLWYAPVSTEPTRHGARIWYQRVDTAEAVYSDQRTLCIGELSRGAWTLPCLHPEPSAWGGINNVCMRRSPHKPTWGGFNVFQIVRTGRSYQMLYWDQPSETGLAGAMLASSPDGKNWTTTSAGTVFTEHNDAFTLLTRNHEYLLYQTALEDWPEKPFVDNIPQKRRVITMRRSDDLHQWTPQALLLHPDAQDEPETEFYLMKAFPYGNGYAGLIMKYYADPALPGKHSGILKNELVVSPDALHWERPFRKTDIGFWTFCDPFLMDNQLHFPIWKDGSMDTVVYAPHRLIAVCAGNTEGSLVSPPFLFRGGKMLVNADTRNGWIELELYAATANSTGPIATRRIENIDDTAVQVTFTSPTRNPIPRGQYTLHFRMQHAKLYAVEIK